MASESPQIETTPPQTGPGDQIATPATDTAKRKAEQSNGTNTRAKRNRYISIAWYDYGLTLSDISSESEAHYLQYFDPVIWIEVRHLMQNQTTSAFDVCCRQGGCMCRSGLTSDFV